MSDTLKICRVHWALSKILVLSHYPRNSRSYTWEDWAERNGTMQGWNEIVTNRTSINSPHNILLNTIHCQTVNTVSQTTPSLQCHKITSTVTHDTTKSSTYLSSPMHTGCLDSFVHTRWNWNEGWGIKHVQACVKDTLSSKYLPTELPDDKFWNTADLYSHR